MHAPLTHHPSLYQINTRVWLRRFDTPQHRATLYDIPPSHWDTLAEKGIDLVWLMGVWETVESAVSAYCFVEPLKKAYHTALPDWTPQDVIGSPYAIGSYTVSSVLGGKEALSALRTQLHQRGMRLILDFVPNHFSAHSPMLSSHPSAFIQGTLTDLQKDPDLFYQPPHTPEDIFAHGRDPYFPPWQDTVQVNYASPLAHQMMCEQLDILQTLCDGVRCDMAMLCLHDVFRRVWGRYVDVSKMPTVEFWQQAIHQTRQKQPSFLFLAEAYWGLEPQLRGLGFDYTYDKELLDALKHQEIKLLKRLLQQPIQEQQRCIRFLENHDEQRAMTVFGQERWQSAAILAYTLPGMRFFHDGQWEGKRIHLPVQLGREPYETTNPETMEEYARLLSLLKDPIYRQGRWSMLSLAPPAPNSDHHEALLAWSWSHPTQQQLVVTNFSSQAASGRIHLEQWGSSKTVHLQDVLHQVTYPRDLEDLQTNGLYVFLEPFQSHIFSWKPL